MYNKLRDLVRGTNRPVLQGSREIYDVTGSQGVLYRPSNAVSLQVSCTVGKWSYETGLELEKKTISYLTADTLLLNYKEQPQN